jgi:hypothetical protein
VAKEIQSNLATRRVEALQARNFLLDSVIGEERAILEDGELDDERIVLGCRVDVDRTLEVLDVGSAWILERRIGHRLRKICKYYTLFKIIIVLQ